MIPSADGLRINLVCTVLITETNPEDISIHWSGAGLRSIWVQQSSISQKGNEYERTLFFDPWIDVHAGDYICRVMINETKCAVEKSITLEGILNSYLQIYCIYVQSYLDIHNVYFKYKLSSCNKQGWSSTPSCTNTNT